MPVTVSHPVNPATREAQTTHEQATSFEVSGGNLIVLRWVSGGNSAVAVYSPGSWASAVVEVAN